MLSSTQKLRRHSIEINRRDVKYKLYVTKSNAYWVKEEFTTQKLHDWKGIVTLAVNREYVFEFFSYMFKATLPLLSLIGWWICWIYFVNYTYVILV